MQLSAKYNLELRGKPKTKIGMYIILLLPLQTSILHAQTSQEYLYTVKDRIGQLLSPAPTTNAAQVNLAELSNFSLDTSRVAELPQVTAAQPNMGSNASVLYNPRPGSKVSFIDAVHTAVQRRPEITQSIATLSAQAATIDVAKANYYPQISGGVGTADLTKGERGRQLLSLNVTQLLYDFGKVKSGVDIEKAKMQQEQARVLVNLDQVAFDVANAIVRIKRFQEITKIAQQQIEGVGRIAEIANLRAKAGISSQADPIQAQSNLEAAQSNLLVQQTQLKQYQQRLRTLLGYDVSNMQWDIPDSVVKQAELYVEPDFSQIPNMILAQTGVQVAQLKKQQTRLSAYPTINVKGSVSQAINGRNPNNDKDNGMYNSIMIEAQSNLYQGGAVGSQSRAASYAEEAARAEVNAAYLDVLDQVRMIREEIENKQKQMDILAQRKATTVRTKELYQEQYKLGTRTVVDLLNAEQAIHGAAQEIESARYDIYSAIVQYIQVTGRSRDLYNLNNLSIQGFEVQP